MWLNWICFVVPVVIVSLYTFASNRSSLSWQLKYFKMCYLFNFLKFDYFSESFKFFPHLVLGRLSKTPKPPTSNYPGHGGGDGIYPFQTRLEARPHLLFRRGSEALNKLNPSCLPMRSTLRCMRRRSLSLPSQCLSYTAGCVHLTIEKAYITLYITFHGFDFTVWSIPLCQNSRLRYYSASLVKMKNGRCIISY